MQLSVRDLAEALRLPPAEIYRWITAREISAATVLDEYRFNRVEVLDWSLHRGIAIHDDLFIDLDEAAPDQTPIADALSRGGVHPLPAGMLGKAHADAIAAAMPELDSTLQALILGPIVQGRAAGWFTLPGLPIAAPRATFPIVADVAGPTLRVFQMNDSATLTNHFGTTRLSTWVWLVVPTPALHLFLLERLGRMLFAQALGSILAGRPTEADLREAIGGREAPQKPGAPS
jgi:hypothetical protein